MPSSQIELIVRWIVPLWALGWLVLPLSSRLFLFLPDHGLAVGRIVALVLATLACFWGASISLVPLSLTPFIFIAAPIAVASGWRDRELRARITRSWRLLLVSDAVFLLGFGAFLWVRLRHPEAGDLEKPMDMALISAALRANWLPFENPWFAGQGFTNYYYFGPLMSALLARELATPPQFAYNLAQPLFCAFFLSSTWSLATALSKSARIGLAAMLLVCVGGHFEPLRQISQTHQLWPLDWWATSRVIPNTINEYPAFTLLIGDLHAHFYAFCLAVTHFCLCFGILKTESVRLRSALLILGGVMLGVIAMTNTWDVPFYGILWLACAVKSREGGRWTPANDYSLGGAIFAAPFVALPYFVRFKSQVSGTAFNLWLPDLFSVALLWGGWWMLGFLAFCFEPGEEKPSSEAIFRRFLIRVGILTLLFPFFFYIRGAFGDGDLRHQDTVFKFGLQAWLLLGTGIACELGFRVKSWWPEAKWPFRFAAVGVSIAFFAVIALAPLCVGWSRAVRDGTRDAEGRPILSLNAAQFLSPGDQEGIEWLRQNAKSGESVVEAVGGDFDANFARVSAFSGVPTLLGWPGHVGTWGDYGAQIAQRTALVKAIYEGPDSEEALRQSGATFVFLGAREPKIAESEHLKLVWQSQDGATQILRFER